MLRSVSFGMLLACALFSTKACLAIPDMPPLDPSLDAELGDAVADTPALDPATDPATDPAPDPGTDPATDPGSDPGTDPATDPGSDPGTDSDPPAPDSDPGPPPLALSAAILTPAEPADPDCLHADIGRFAPPSQPANPVCSFHPFDLEAQVSADGDEIGEGLARLCFPDELPLHVCNTQDAVQAFGPERATLRWHLDPVAYASDHAPPGVYGLRVVASRGDGSAPPSCAGEVDARSDVELTLERPAELVITSLSLHPSFAPGVGVAPVGGLVSVNATFEPRGGASELPLSGLFEVCLLWEDGASDDLTLVGAGPQATGPCVQVNADTSLPPWKLWWSYEVGGAAGTTWTGELMTTLAATGDTCEGVVLDRSAATFELGLKAPETCRKDAAPQSILEIEVLCPERGQAGCRSTGCGAAVPCVSALVGETVEVSALARGFDGEPLGCYAPGMPWVIDARGADSTLRLGGTAIADTGAAPATFAPGIATAEDGRIRFTATADDASGPVRFQVSEVHPDNGSTLSTGLSRGVIWRHGVADSLEVVAATGDAPSRYPVRVEVRFSDESGRLLRHHPLGAPLMVAVPSQSGIKVWGSGEAGEGAQVVTFETGHKTDSKGSVPVWVCCGGPFMGVEVSASSGTLHGSSAPIRWRLPSAHGLHASLPAREARVDEMVALRIAFVDAEGLPVPNHRTPPGTVLEIRPSGGVGSLISYHAPGFSVPVAAGALPAYARIGPGLELGEDGALTVVVQNAWPEGPVGFTVLLVDDDGSVHGRERARTTTEDRITWVE